MPSCEQSDYQQRHTSACVGSMNWNIDISENITLPYFLLSITAMSSHGYHVKKIIIYISTISPHPHHSTKKS